MNRPIAISLSPNTEADDVNIALNTLFSFGSWKKGSSIKKVDDWFRKKFSVDSVYSFNSGRTAFYGLLQSFSIGSGDEVIVQAFTCVAVPEVVMWVGATPVYCDIDDSYNIDPAKLEKLISKKTKAIVVQHTFGIPADIKKIKKIVEKHRIILIEDCAHSLGAAVDGELVGSFGDAAFFSFGRDKVISSVFGGVAIINSQSATSIEKLSEFHLQLEYPSYSWIIQQLLHPILFHSFILPFYNVFGIGKLFLVFSQRIKLLSFPVKKSEYTGKMPHRFLTKYPNALAVLILNQLFKLDRYNARRREIAQKYSNDPLIKGAIYLRFPIQIEDRDNWLHTTKNKGILLGNWYHHTIDPKQTKFNSIGYIKGSCPNAEKLAHGIGNLPTYPTMTDHDIERVIRIIRSS